MHAKALVTEKTGETWKASSELEFQVAILVIPKSHFIGL